MSRIEASVAVLMVSAPAAALSQDHSHGNMPMNNTALEWHMPMMHGMGEGGGRMMMLPGMAEFTPLDDSFHSGHELGPCAHC